MKTIAMLLIVMALESCSGKYHCDKFPVGTCKNMSQVYDATGRQFADYRDGKISGSSKPTTNDGPSILIGETINSLNVLRPGDPLLTRPKVLKVWIKPWEDKDHDLNYSYIIIRVGDSEWTAVK